MPVSKVKRVVEKATAPLKNAVTKVSDANYLRKEKKAVGKTPTSKQRHDYAVSTSKAGKAAAKKAKKVK
jgi:hypothetical protein